jgi:spore maturation protein CgeB
MDAAQDLYKNSHKTVEQSLMDTLIQHNMNLNMDMFKSMMRCAEPLDWMIRMHYRKKVINELLNAGYEVSVIGRGWENFANVGNQRLNILGDRIPFKETYIHMENAKINLNVMPWFKGGTHDRIFNSLLLKSVSLTDTSSWLKESFIDGEDIAFYSLSELDKLPGQVKELLENEERSMKIAENGSKKVLEKYVWKNCVDTILKAIN